MVFTLEAACEDSVRSLGESVGEGESGVFEVRVRRVRDATLEDISD
jgi:hypothetical protein